MEKNENQLKLAMRLVHLGRSAWQGARDKLSDEVLTNMQYKICAVVKLRPGVSQDGVAQELFMDKSSTAKLVSKLVADGYIRREKNPDDRREYRLYLTEEGKAITEPFAKAIEEWEMEKLGGVDGEDYQALKRILAKLEG